MQLQPSPQSKPLPNWRKQHIFLQQCKDFSEKTGARMLVIFFWNFDANAIQSNTHPSQCILIMPDEGGEPSGSVSMDGGMISVSTLSEAVVFDSMSTSGDIAARNQMARESATTTSFPVKIQGKVSAVVNGNSLEAFKEYDRVAKRSEPSVAAKRQRLLATPSYASVFTPVVEEIARPLFLRPVLPPCRPIQGASKPLDQPFPTMDARPPTPVMDRPRLASTESIVAGCMFPINDMLDMASLQSRPPSDTEIMAISALAELTAGRA